MHVPGGTESPLTDLMDGGSSSEDLQAVSTALWHRVQRGNSLLLVQGMRTGCAGALGMVGNRCQYIFEALVPSAF